VAPGELDLAGQAAAAVTLAALGGDPADSAGPGAAGCASAGPEPGGDVVEAVSIRR